MEALDIEARLTALLDQARADARLPMSDRGRIARLVLNHGQFLNTVPEILASTRGQRDILLRLAKLVDDLLDLCFVDPHGRSGWSTEVPRGRAPAVREKLNELQKFMKGEIQ